MSIRWTEFHGKWEWFIPYNSKIVAQFGKNNRWVKPAPCIPIKMSVFLVISSWSVKLIDLATVNSRKLRTIEMSRKTQQTFHSWHFAQHNCHFFSAPKVIRLHSECVDISFCEPKMWFELYHCVFHATEYPSAAACARRMLGRGHFVHSHLSMWRLMYVCVGWSKTKYWMINENNRYSDR